MQASGPKAKTNETTSDLSEEAGGLSSAASDLAILLQTAWHGRRTVVAAALACALLMAVYAILTPPWYRATVSLLPVQNRAGSEILTQLGGLSSLASLAGINPTGNTAEPIAVLESHDFARSFIERQNLLPILFADKWDEEAGQWKTTVRKVPDIIDAVERFEDSIRRVGQDRETGLIVLTVDWTDPKTAAAWANAMAEQINADMRARAIEDAESKIAYLRAELATTNHITLQTSISRLLESQMQNLMVAKGNEEYAFRVIDKALEPKKHFKPKRALLVVGSALIGAFLAAAALVLFRDPAFARTR